MNLTGSLHVVEEIKMLVESEMVSWLGLMKREASSGHFTSIILMFFNESSPVTHVGGSSNVIHKSCVKCCSN